MSDGCCFRRRKQHREPRYTDIIIISNTELWVENITHAFVHRSVSSTHGSTESIQEGTEVTTLIGSVDHKVDGFVPKNLRHNHVQSEESLTREGLSATG